MVHAGQSLLGVAIVCARQLKPQEDIFWQEAGCPYISSSRETTALRLSSRALNLEHGLGIF